MSEAENSSVINSSAQSVLSAKGLQKKQTQLATWFLALKKIDLTHSFIFFSLFISCALVLSLGATLLLNGLPILFDEDAALLSHTWHPASGQFGVFPMLYGTVIVAAIAVLLSAPVGVFSALAISEYLPRSFRIPVKCFLEVLAGIPSIIYGLIGIALLSPLVSNLFDLQSGRTVLAASILLAIMILPTIITLCEDALHAIPICYRESSYSLGFYKHEVIIDTLLPIVKIDFIGAILLALGRALGETMAVMLLIGSIDRIPNPWSNILAPAQTITSKLGREISESAFGSSHFQALVFLSLILILIGLATSMFVQVLSKSSTKHDN